MKVSGQNKDFFLIEQSKNWLIAGGIKGENKKDNKIVKNLEIKTKNFTISMKKGFGHAWTCFSEDSILTFQNTVFAVFDGVSGDCKGKGGICSRFAAELLKEMLLKSEFNLKTVDNFINSYLKKCNEQLLDGATTAIIVFIFGKHAILYNKGDSLCFIGNKQLNKTHNIGNMLTTCLNDPHSFDKYEFKITTSITLASDGIKSPDYDDVSIIKINI